MSNEFKIDASEVYNLFKDLDSKNQAKVLKQGLRRAAGIIARETKKNLKRQLGQSATHNGEYGPMIKGVKVKIYKEKKFGAETYPGKVHIMGDFRLKWFEMGTKERHWKRKNKSTGSIKPLYFFKSAVDVKEKEAYDSLEKYITNSIMKVYNKK